MHRDHTLQIDDLRSGDLLFFARPSFIQRLSGYVGDGFRGVAVFDRIDGHPAMHLCGRGNGFETRSLIDAIPAYDHVAVGRSPRCRCTAEMLDWIVSHLSEPASYQTSALVPAFWLSWARNPATNGLPGMARSVVWPLVVLDGCWRSLIVGRSNAYICSTWVGEGQRLVCPRHRLGWSLTSAKPTAGSVRRPDTSPAWRRALDRLLARWHLTPSDLWRALPEHRRAELDLVALQPAVVGEVKTR